jgi:hypothetical protein
MIEILKLHHFFSESFPMLNTPLEILAKDPFILGSLIGGMNHIWGDYLLGSVMRGLISGVTSGIFFGLMNLSMMENQFTNL